MFPGAHVLYHLPQDPPPTFKTLGALLMAPTGRLLIFDIDEGIYCLDAPFSDTPAPGVWTLPA